MAEMKTEEIWEFEKKPRLEKEIEKDIQKEIQKVLPSRRKRTL